MTPSPLDPVPTGERMCYYIRSERKPSHRYRVDLLANNGHGFCECVDHATRRQPFLDAAGSGFDKRGRCKHVFRAREFFLRGLLTEMSRQENSPAHAHH